MRVVWVALLVSSGGLAEMLRYKAEWRLMEAGLAELEWSNGGGRLRLETTGMVKKLYRVQDEYTVSFDRGLCASSSLMKAEEGKKRIEQRVTYHRSPPKAELVERDLIKNAVTRTSEIDIPPCVHEVLSALARLRGMKLEAGGEAWLPLSDGKKSAMVRVAALKKETVHTPAGVFPTTRYEAFLLNNVIYRRKGRLFVWLTDDERRLPVQFRIQLPFYLGTITLQLNKEGTG